MMNKYEQHSLLSDNDFRRLTGVHKTTFELMLAVLSQQISQAKKLPGRPSRLSVADQLLMMLEYNREYRTYFHIAQSYQVSEATATADRRLPPDYASGKLPNQVRSIPLAR